LHGAAIVHASTLPAWHGDRQAVGRLARPAAKA
jgi:hypothetical protein